MFKKVSKMIGLLLILALMVLGLFCVAYAASSSLSISAPRDGGLYSFDGFPKVKWNSVSGAAGYRVAIKNLNTNESMLLNKWTTSTSMSVSSYIDDIGKYKIWVGAYASSSDTAIISADAQDTIEVVVSHEPDISNGSASNVTDSSAKLSMTINRDYGTEIEDWGFYVGTSSTTSRMTKYSNGYTKKGTKTATITGLESGTKYYYRAFAENAAGEEISSASSFTTGIGNLDKPMISTPVDGDTHVGYKSITVKWSKVKNAKGYRYHIKRLKGEPDRGNNNEPEWKAWEKSTSSTSFTLDGTEAIGNYWYKFVIEAYADGVESSWSNHVYVYVKNPVLGKPVISTPVDGSSVEGGQSISVRWSATNANSYHYYIKQLKGEPDRGNKNEPAINTWENETTSTSYTLKASDVIGGYWYKFVIKATTKDGQEEWSDWCYVKVEKPALGKPEITNPVDGQEYSGNQSLKFQWTKAKNASKYHYIVKRLNGMPDRTNNNEKGTVICDDITTSTSCTVNGSDLVGDKWYKFVVEALGNGTEPESTWAEWCYIKVVKPTLAKAKVVAPKDGETYTGYKTLTFDWNSVTGATGYNYYIKRLKYSPDRTNDNEPFHRQWKGSTTSTEFSLSADDTIPGYWYKFVVEAYGNDVNSSWSEWVYCYIDEAHLSSPVISSPSNYSNSGIGSSITVSWSKVTDADGYKCHIKRLYGDPDTSNNNEPGVELRREDCGTSTKYTLSGNEALGGYWYKFVIEAYARNVASSWSNWVYVKVPETGNLERPTITSPLASHDYDAGSGISFTWNKVPNATSYVYYVKQLAGEPDYSSNEKAVKSWSSATQGTRFTLDGKYVLHNTWYKFVVEARADGYNSSWSKYTYIKVPDREDWVHFTLSSSLSLISEEMYEGNALLRTFDASGSKLRSIESRAFANCTNLKSIKLPSTVSSIADDAFYNCPALTIHCASGSYAETYANRKGIPVEIHGMSVASDIVQVSQSNWTIGTDKAEKAITVSSSSTWSASSNQSWLKLSTSSGSNGASVVMSAAKNETGSSRSAQVSFKCGNATATVDVEQSGGAGRDPVVSGSWDDAETIYITLGGAYQLNGSVYVQNGTLGNVSISVANGDNRALNNDYKGNVSSINLANESYFLINTKTNKNFNKAGTYTIALYAKAYGSSNAVKIGTRTLVIKEPETAKTPLVKFSMKNGRVINNGSGKLELTVSTTYADRFYVEVLNGSTPITIYDQWAGSVKKREYNASDFKNTGGSMYTTSSRTWDLITPSIPSGTPVGSYTVRVTAENDQGKTNVAEKSLSIVNTLDVSVTGVTLNKTSLSLMIGESETLTYSVQPSNATNKGVTWSSSNNSVATVANGKVTAVEEGSATIKVTTLDGNKTASCTITVNSSQTEEKGDVIDISKIGLSNKKYDISILKERINAVTISSPLIVLQQDTMANLGKVDDYEMLTDHPIQTTLKGVGKVIGIPEPYDKAKNKYYEDAARLSLYYVTGAYQTEANAQLETLKKIKGGIRNAEMANDIYKIIKLGKTDFVTAKELIGESTFNSLPGGIIRDTLGSEKLHFSLNGAVEFMRYGGEENFWKSTRKMLLDAAEETIDALINNTYRRASLLCLTDNIRALLLSNNFDSTYTALFEKLLSAAESDAKQLEDLTINLMYDAASNYGNSKCVLELKCLMANGDWIKCADATEQFTVSFVTAVWLDAKAAKLAVKFGREYADLVLNTKDIGKQMRNYSIMLVTLDNALTNLKKVAADTPNKATADEIMKLYCAFDSFVQIHTGTVASGKSMLIAFYGTPLQELFRDSSSLETWSDTLTQCNENVASVKKYVVNSIVNNYPDALKTYYG